VIVAGGGELLPVAVQPQSRDDGRRVIFIVGRKLDDARRPADGSRLAAQHERAVTTPASRDEGCHSADKLAAGKRHARLAEYVEMDARRYSAGARPPSVLSAFSSRIVQPVKWPTAAAGV
jgi:hypothetical protein